MNERIRQEILEAIGERSAEEVSELAAELKERFQVDRFETDFTKEKLRLFKSVRQKIPTLWYDGGPSITYYLDDPGSDLKAFTELMRKKDKDFNLAAAKMMKYRCERGETYRIDLQSFSLSYEFRERLRAMNAVFTEFVDDVADYDTVQYTELPKGLEEDLYQAVVNYEGGVGQISGDEEYVVRIFRVYPEQGVRELLAPDGTFVFRGPETDRKGEPFWKVITCLNWEEIHRMRRKEEINFECGCSNVRYFVRARASASAPKKNDRGRESRPDLHMLGAEIASKFFPDQKVEAIRLYRQKTGVGLREAKEAVEQCFRELAETLK